MKVRSFTITAVAVVLLAGLTACTPPPPHEPPTDPWTAAVGQCWESIPAFASDLALVGPKNTPDNGQYYSSDDGSCAGPSFSPTIVQAADATEAKAVCASVQGFQILTPARVADFWAGTGIPADAWTCTP